MSNDSEPVPVYGCRWAWCRLTFSDNDALSRHVVFKHVRRAIPVRRKDLTMLRRAEEGLGDSLRVSDFMHDPSSELSKEPAPSQQQLPPSSSLPSPPASSPLSPSQDQNFLQDMEHKTSWTDVHPTFASLGSPAGSLTSFQIPASPTFSTLVRGANKRKETSETQQEGKRSRQDDSSLESVSAVSTGSQRSVEEHLTQTSEGDVRDNNESDEDIGCSQPDCSREDVVMIPPPSEAPLSSSSLLPESSQQSAYKGELSWDEPHVLSPRFISQPSCGSSQERSIKPFPESLSQPPSQLQLASSIYRTKSSSPLLQTSQFDANSSILSLPLNPAALLVSPPTGFIASTPQRQTWYQSAPRRRVSSRSTSGAMTPKPSSRGPEPTGALPDTGEEQSQLQQCASKTRQTPHPRESPSIKRSGFRSGTLQLTPSASHHQIDSQSQSPARPQPITSHTIADEDTRNVSPVRHDSAIPEERPNSWETQSQSDQHSLMSPNMSSTSYPPLQTQAPYQSQSLSQ